MNDQEKQSFIDLLKEEKKKLDRERERFSSIFNREKEDNLNYYKELKNDNVNKTKGSFCKDCKHYIKHPFINRCGIKNIEVDPMDDCELFEKKR